MKVFSKLLGFVLCLTVASGMMTIAGSAVESCLYQQLFESEDDIKDGCLSLSSGVSNAESATTAFYGYDFVEDGCVEDSEKSIKFTARRPSSETTDAYGRVRIFNITNVVEFEKGKKYELSWYAKSAPGDGDGANPGLRFFVNVAPGTIKYIDANGSTQTQQYPHSEINCLSKSWRRYSMSFTVTDLIDADSNPNDGKVTGSIMVEGKNFDVGDYIWIDEIRWTEQRNAMVTVNITGDGSVEYEGSTLQSGDSFTLNKDGDGVILNVTSNDKTKSARATVNGKKAAFKGNKLILAQVNEDLNIDITFESPALTYQNYFENDTDAYYSSGFDSIIDQGGASAYLNADLSVEQSDNDGGAMRVEIIKDATSDKIRIFNVVADWEPGYTYKVSFKYKGSTTTTSSSSMAFQFGNTKAPINTSDGKVINGYTSNGITPSKTTWKTASFNLFTIDKLVTRKSNDAAWVVQENPTPRSSSLMFFVPKGSKIGDYLLIDDFEVERIPALKTTVSVTEGGTVTRNYYDVNDEATNGEVYYSTASDTLKFTIAPDEGKKAVVKLNGTEQVVPDSGAFSFKVSGDTALDVTFEDANVPAGIENSKTTSWFKTVDGKPTIYVYTRLSSFTSGENLNFGIKLWDKVNPDAAAVLLARDGEGTPYVATPGMAFAIKAYGNAIKADRSYEAVPFIGDAEGTAQIPLFED